MIPQQVLSSKQAAATLGISQRRIQQLLGDGRIEGAQRVGSTWIVPSPVKVIPGTRGPIGVAGERRHSNDTGAEIRSYVVVQ